MNKREALWKAFKTSIPKLPKRRLKDSEKLVIGGLFAGISSFVGVVGLACFIVSLGFYIDAFVIFAFSGAIAGLVMCVFGKAAEIMEEAEKNE